MTAREFEARLRASAPAHVSAIGEVIARRSLGRVDVADGVRIWQDIRERDATVFEFSPGGDLVQAIAWSHADQRFYHVLECC